MMITKDNYFEDTFANFKEISKEEFKKLEFENYENHLHRSFFSGSEYWLIDGNKILRASNHWGEHIGTCSWFLNGKECYSLKRTYTVKYGICPLNEFFKKTYGICLFDLKLGSTISGAFKINGEIFCGTIKIEKEVREIKPFMILDKDFNDFEDHYMMCDKGRLNAIFYVEAY